jgi:predicted CoA-binding protein
MANPFKAWPLHFRDKALEMNNKKKTMVLGASGNPARYSYLAINRLRAHDHPVVAVGKRNTQVGDVPISTDHIPERDIDTITLYLNPKNQVEYYDYILNLNPKRIIFNPGTENDELIKKARENNIKPVIGCTLVMLSTGQY